MARTVVVMITYDRDIENPMELEKIHGTVNEQYEGVESVFASVVTPEKATQIRMGLPDPRVLPLPARTPDPQPFPGDD